MSGADSAPVVVPTGDVPTTIIASIIATAVKFATGFETRRSLTRRQRLAFEAAGGQIQRLGGGRRRFIYKGQRIGIAGAEKVARQQIKAPPKPKPAPPPPPPKIVSRPPPPNLPQPWQPPQTDEELEQFYEESGLEETDIGVWDPAYGWSGLIKKGPEAILGQIAATIPKADPLEGWSYDRPPTRGRPPVRTPPGIPPGLDWPKLPNVVMPLWWLLYGIFNPNTTVTQKQEEEAIKKSQPQTGGRRPGRPNRPKVATKPKEPKEVIKVIEKTIERVIYQPILNIPTPAPAPPAPAPTPAPPAPAPTIIIAPPAPTPKTPLKLGNYLNPLLLALLAKPKTSKKRRTASQLQPQPLTDLQTSPLVSSEGEKCECKPKQKEKRKKKKRTICYTGTYTEYADGLVKRKRRKVKCNVRRNSKGNLGSRRRR